MSEPGTEHPRMVDDLPPNRRFYAYLALAAVALMVGSILPTISLISAQRSNTRVQDVNRRLALAAGQVAVDVRNYLAQLSAFRAQQTCMVIAELARLEHVTAPPASLSDVWAADYCPVLLTQPPLAEPTPPASIVGPQQQRFPATPPANPLASSGQSRVHLVVPAPSAAPRPANTPAPTPVPAPHPTASPAPRHTPAAPPPSPAASTVSVCIYTPVTGIVCVPPTPH